MTTYRVTFRAPGPIDTSVMVDAEQHILEAGLDAGFALPFRCLQGWCLTCAVRVIDGSVDQTDSRRFFPEDRADGFALICTGKPRSDLTLETHAREAMRRSRDRHDLPYPKGDWGDGDE